MTWDYINGWIDDTGAQRIQAERLRQTLGEGWTPEHDDEHVAGQLLLAAISYARAAYASDPVPYLLSAPPHEWPWNHSWWKPSTDPIRNLEKAGALIAAEIDRLLRARES